MNVILDTNVFLGISRGDEECAKIEAKIIRDCDLVFITNDIILEYSTVLGRFGLKEQIIHSNLSRYLSHNKLRSKKKSNKIDNIITHEKDRHLIECAYYNNCSIITYEKKHLLNYKKEIKSTLNIDILSLEEYMKIES